MLPLSLVLACFALAPSSHATDTGGVVAGNNTADGSGVLLKLTTGINNSGFGFQALFSDNSGSYNTANGVEALYNNTTGGNNVANGFLALFNNTTGNDNTATGVVSLDRNTGGSFNTANGYQALYHNTTGGFNTAIGMNALLSNTIGSFNTAMGYEALLNNTNNASTGGMGAQNTAIGSFALLHNTTGQNNVAIGNSALDSNTLGSNNIAIGNSAGHFTTGSNEIDIGNGGGGQTNTIHIGNNGHVATFIAGIWGPNVGGTSGLPVFVNSAGQLGTNANSSRRFKRDIADMNSASDVLLSMRPVTFRYKPEVDAKGSPQWGLVAEEVAELNPDLVVRDAKGEIFGVRYEAVNAMLLNEFLKEHRKVEAQQSKIDNQQATITELKSTLAQQQQRFESRLAGQDKQIEVLTLGLQKVSAQLEARKPAPQMAFNNQ